MNIGGDAVKKDPAIVGTIGSLDNEARPVKPSRSEHRIMANGSVDP